MFKIEVDWVADAGVLGHALVGEVDLAVFSHGDVLEECVEQTQVRE